MIKSMTGFGRAESHIANKTITVEVKSLNSKQFDLSLRLPSLYRPIESELRAAAAASLGRGKCDIMVSVASSAQSAVNEVDSELLAHYAKQIESACKAANLEFNIADAIPSILRMPEVISSRTEEVTPEESAEIKRCLDAALAALNAFREQEGATLIADLLQRVDTIETLMNAVVPYEPQRLEVIKKRIKDNIAKLQVDVDSNRLEAEMIFYAERYDITEEKVRLAAHCAYFREVARSEEGVGRKMGFIAQEMGREINTMGSKANDTDIQRLVVEMKDELEKIKEQLLNIL